MDYFGGEQFDLLILHLEDSMNIKRRRIGERERTIHIKSFICLFKVVPPLQGTEIFLLPRWHD